MTGGVTGRAVGKGWTDTSLGADPRRLSEAVVAAVTTIRVGTDTMTEVGVAATAEAAAAMPRLRAMGLDMT